VDRGSNQRSVLPGKVLSMIGLAFAVIGAYYVSVATNVLGLILGMGGYVMGSRILGSTAALLCLVSIFVGIFFGQSVSQF
jgi:hypothetical protein